MSTTPTPLKWKIAATVGAITGVSVGGFVLAAPGSSPAGPANPSNSIVDDVLNSVPRLSAPVVVPETVPATAPVTTLFDSVNLGPDTTLDQLTPDTPTPDTAAPDNTASVPSPVSPLTPASPVSPASPASPASPVSPASPDTP